MSPMYFGGLALMLNNRSFQDLNILISCYLWVILVNEGSESWKESSKVKQASQER